MIGIYKITKIENGKSYIGKSNDIERRFKEHQTKGKTSRIPVDEAIEKYVDSKTLGQKNSTPLEPYLKWVELALKTL